MNDPELLLAQGNTLFVNGQFAEAEACYRQVCESQPNDAQAANNLGVALAEQGLQDEAETWYRRAIDIDTGYYEAHFNLGNLLRSLKRWDDACTSYQRALEIQPGSAAALTNLALAHSWAGRVDQALDNYQRAIDVDAEHAAAHNGLGLMFQRLGRLGQAEQCFNHAVDLDPQSPYPHVNRAQLWLLQQRLDEGFREFQWRWRLPAMSVSAGMPQWNGEPIDGRRLLLWVEQGLGDTIMLLRFAEQLRHWGAQVLLQCPPSMHGLLSTCQFIDRVCDGSEADIKADYHCPLFDLPRILDTTVESIPQVAPYLRADDQLIRHWAARMADLPGFKIGIAWQGSRDYPEDCHRSIPLSCFGPIAAVDDVTLVSLQMGDGKQQATRATPPFSLTDWSGEMDQSGAFLDTAALLTQLDLVITCDTSIGHLAGALSVPVWIALSVACDWRWFTQRTDSPWYPTARLYRQSRLDDWQDVFKSMAQDLSQHMA